MEIQTNYGYVKKNTFLKLFEKTIISLGYTVSAWVKLECTQFSTGGGSLVGKGLE